MRNEHNVWPWTVLLTMSGLVAMSGWLIVFKHWSPLQIAIDLAEAMVVFMIVMSVCKFP